MLIFIAWDGDHIGRQVGRASRNDDVEGLRRISQAIDQGNNIWRSWVESTGGSLISMGGDEGRAEVAADHIGELPAIREQYSGKVGSTVSVGVGMKLSEAEKALIAAKLKGEDQIVFFSDECDELIEKARAKGEKTEEDKIADAYLSKAAPGMNEGAGAGFAGATRPSAPTVDKPIATQGDSDEMAALDSVLGDENAPGAPESTHAAADFERQLHDEAWKGEEEDMSSDTGKAQRLEAVKAQVVEALTALKLQQPLMEQVKQVAPQAYKAMLGLTQAVVGMARELMPSQQGAQPMDKSEKKPIVDAQGRRVTGGMCSTESCGYKAYLADGYCKSCWKKGKAKRKEPVKKSETLAKSTDKAQKYIDSIRAVLADDIKPEDKGPQHCMKGHCYVAAETLHHLLGGAEAGWTPHNINHEGGPHWFLKHAGGRVLDPTADQFHSPIPYDKGQGKGFLTALPSARTKEVLERLLGEGHLKPKQAAEIPGTRNHEQEQAKEQQLDKGGLPMPGAPAHSHLNLPSGSTLNGKIKVTHQDGKQSWKQVEAGMITSQDPSHHPTSSRSPSSK